MTESWWSGLIFTDTRELSPGIISGNFLSLEILWIMILNISSILLFCFPSSKTPIILALLLQWMKFHFSVSAWLFSLLYIIVTLFVVFLLFSNALYHTFISRLFSLSFGFLGPWLQHMEGPRLGVELELQLPAYTTATATWDPSCICDLHHSSWQCWILNPLSEARDQTQILRNSSQTHYNWAMTGTARLFSLEYLIIYPAFLK